MNDSLMIQDSLNVHKMYWKSCYKIPFICLSFSNLMNCFIQYDVIHRLHPPKLEFRYTDTLDLRIIKYDGNDSNPVKFSSHFSNLDFYTHFVDTPTYNFTCLQLFIFSIRYRCY